MRLTFFFILCFNFSLVAQNLVPNSSFELASDTISRTTLTCKEFNINIDDWKTPITTADIINPKVSSWRLVFPRPHSGDKMVGILNFYRTILEGIETKKPYCEYVGVKLKEPLLPNKTYYVEYWIRRCGFKNPKLNKDDIMNPYFGILFSSEDLNGKDKISSFVEGIYGTPQIIADTQLLITDKEWVKISKYFTPTKPYNFLCIGQFLNQEEKPILMKGYYLIDDVSVEAIADFSAINKKVELPIGSIIPLSNVNFLSGTTTLSDNLSYKLLKDLANYLNANPSIRIRINGHTDANGNEESNMSLSTKRAKSIAQILIQNGVNKNIVEWKGFGELLPIADNMTPGGRLKNRRVEFEVIE
jgi:outer membrane protein OmpA-like peptidoglycan-associated protein